MTLNRLFTAIIALTISASISPFAQDTSTPASWTSKDGRVIQAKFVKLDGEAVVVEKDSKEVTIPFAKLSAASVEQAKKAATAVPDGFSLIPAGEFTMGDVIDGDKTNLSHPVSVSAFYMGQKEVTKGEWDAVRTWGLANGYTDLEAGAGKANDHPVQTVTWWGVVKWCNARSEREGLTPCYTVNGAVMRSGTTEPTVNWTASGYRLPTEAEWEKAARGGLNGKRFPRGDTISHTQANFQNKASAAYQTGTTGYHPIYSTGKWLSAYTSPVGSFDANSYGLHDMSGNVQEWCWDRWGKYPSGTQTDPRGAASGEVRVLRGGSWEYAEMVCRVAMRRNMNPILTDNDIGFRVARGQPVNSK